MPNSAWSPFILVAYLTLGFLASAWALTPLSQPRPRTATDYNYSNGETGHQATGLTLEEAGDIAEEKTPLASPELLIPIIENGLSPNDYGLATDMRGLEP